MTDEHTTKPDMKIRMGQITATIWKKTVSGNDGDYEVYNTVIEKSYKDKEGEWNSTSSFQLNELPKVRILSDKAYEYICGQSQSKEK